MTKLVCFYPSVDSPSTCTHLFNEVQLPEEENIQQSIVSQSFTDDIMTPEAGGEKATKMLFMYSPLRKPKILQLNDVFYDTLCVEGLCSD